GRLGEGGPVGRRVGGCTGEGRPGPGAGYPAAWVRGGEGGGGLGLDIAGSAFVMVGEPITEAKHAAVRSVGAIPIACYASVEAGFLANSCSRSRPPDEMHLFTDSFALIQHRRRLDRFGVEVA